MSCYFDHFMIVNMFFLCFSDFFIMLFIMLIIYNVLFMNINLMPNSFQFIFEKILEHWKEIVLQNLGGFSYFLLPLITLFFFLMGANLFGFFLYSFPMTTHLSMTLGLSLIFWLGVMVYSLVNFKFSFFSMFMPNGAPLFMSPILVLMEFVSHLSSPVALGMRLAANLTAGHILLSMLSDFGVKMLFYSGGFFSLFPILVIMFMVLLEMAVLVIQAYVFCLLMVIYLKDSLMLH